MEAERQPRQGAPPSRLDRASQDRHQGGMLIYKIFRAPEWEALAAAGETRGAPVDLADGFIHFSTATQAAETAARHFAGLKDLWLVAVDAAACGADLAWEPSRGGELFPHLYRPLRMADVLWARPLPLIGGAHRFPTLT
jgi:uncharacterized protein (DUF952 family)